MFERFRNIVDEWACDYFRGGGRGGLGWGGGVGVGNFCMTHGHIVDEWPCDDFLGGGEVGGRWDWGEEGNF